MSEPEFPSARPYMAKSLPRPSPYHWKADEHMRVNDCGEHWCIWTVDQDGKLAHTEPVATVWNYLYPGRQHADLIEQAPTLKADNARLRALNAELVAVSETIQRALDCAACMLCDAVEDRPIKASELTDIAGGLTVHAQTARAAIAKANAEGGQTDDTGTGEELR